MYQALYRKYRPQTFDDVVGQQAVCQTIKNQILTGKMSHAYLFTGSRGTGKTSSARILAKAVNCENPQDGNPCNCCNACLSIDSGACMDILEIDAASNNGVDNVRDLRDDAIYSPSQVKKRVYIIDEVHMMSTSAFNALLKILEEPPEHLLFVLATTELHKIPATILSRCQRFSFRRIGQDDIAARLQDVAYQEKIELEDSAARILARMADGGMRDGLSLLDQCASAITGELTAEKVYACLGIAGIQQCGKLMACIANKDSAGALALLNRFYAEGKDMGALLDEMSCLARDFMIMKTAPQEGISMLSGVASQQEVIQLSNAFSQGELVRMLEQIRKTVSGFTRSSSRRMDAELCIMNLCQPELTLDAQAMNARLTRLEDQLKSGCVAVAAPVAVTPAPILPEQPEPEPEWTAEPAAELEDQTPDGFWSALSEQIREELMPPFSGFFAYDPNAPIYGVVKGKTVQIICRNEHLAGYINRPEILQVVERKAAARLGYPVRAIIVDGSADSTNSQSMEQLLQFGREHANIVTIKK